MKSKYYKILLIILCGHLEIAVAASLHSVPDDFDNSLHSSSTAPHMEASAAENGAPMGARRYIDAASPTGSDSIGISFSTAPSIESPYDHAIRIHMNDHHENLVDLTPYQIESIRNQYAPIMGIIDPTSIFDHCQYIVATSSELSTYLTAANTFFESRPDLTLLVIGEGSSLKLTNDLLPTSLRNIAVVSETVTETENYFLTNRSNLAIIDVFGLKGIRIIKNWFLSGCNGITELVMFSCNKVHSIGDWFFYGWEIIESYALPPMMELQEIGHSFFGGCPHLRNLKIIMLKKLNKIGRGFVADCPELELLELFDVRKLMLIDGDFLNRSLDNLQNIEMENSTNLVRELIQAALDRNRQYLHMKHGEREYEHISRDLINQYKFHPRRGQSGGAGAASAIESAVGSAIAGGAGSIISDGRMDYAARRISECDVESWDGRSITSTVRGTTMQLIKRRDRVVQQLALMPQSSATTSMIPLPSLVSSPTAVPVSYISIGPATTAGAGSAGILPLSLRPTAASTPYTSASTTGMSDISSLRTIEGLVTTSHAGVGAAPLPSAAILPVGLNSWNSMNNLAKGIRSVLGKRH